MLQEVLAVEHTMEASVPMAAADGGGGRGGGGRGGRGGGQEEGLLLY